MRSLCATLTLGTEQGRDISTHMLVLCPHLRYGHHSTSSIVRRYGAMATWRKHPETQDAQSAAEPRRDEEIE